MTALRVTAPAGAFRRAGMAFGPQAAELHIDTLSAAQVVQLIDEPRLTIEASPDGEHWYLLTPDFRLAIAAAFRGAGDGGDADGAASGERMLDAMVAVYAASTTVAAGEVSDAATEPAAEAGVDPANATADAPSGDAAASVEEPHSKRRPAKPKAGD
ncbi:MAG: hypothetical protein ACOY45_01770 [Pseudomonadota bacterium]